MESVCSLTSLSPRLAQQSKFVVEQSKAVIGRLSPRLVKQSELVVEQSQALASRLRRPTSDSGLAGARSSWSGR